MVGWLGAFYVQGIDPTDTACMSPMNTIYGEQTPIMQFTGLFDKNGKEIYEGDIITFTETDEDSGAGREETHTGKIEWLTEYAQFMFIYPSGQRRGLHTITDFEPVYKCEIIGNIYENPELIN